MTLKKLSFVTNHIKELELIESQIAQQSNILSNLKNSQNITDENISNFIDKVSNIIENNNKILLELKEYWNETSTKIEDLLRNIKSSEQTEIDKRPEIVEIKQIIDDYNNSFRNKKQIITDNTVALLDLLDKENLSNIKLDNQEISLDNLIGEQDILDNNILMISEKSQQVFLPYTKLELEEYLKQFPQRYNSIQDVINQEFVYPLSYYTNHTNLARFRECYSLVRDKEGKSVLDALKYAFEFMFRYEINPAIIAACKTQAQFEAYLEALEKNKLDGFNDFKIVFNVSPNATTI